MKYIRRDIEGILCRAAKAFPCVVLTGPRRAGKTFLLRKLFPEAGYILLEDPAAVARFEADPEGFLDSLTPPVILDEIQNVPEVFNYLRARVDAAPRRTGQWLITGSHESHLMRGVTESMAGRAAVLHLSPLACSEDTRVDLFLGGFPEVLSRPAARDLWFSSYLQTYIERDVRSILEVQNLGLFRRFLALVASRHGQVLNKSDLASPLGMSVPGISKWLDVLSVTGHIILLQPFFENLGKRLIKSPKIYISDSGLACHLLGIQSRRELERSPFLGAIFEGAVAAEILKKQANLGKRQELYYFRDQQGLEVDFIIPTAHGQFLLAEAKAARTVVPSDAKALHQLGIALEFRHKASYIIHRNSKVARPASNVVAPNVKTIDWRQCSTLV